MLHYLWNDQPQHDQQVIAISEDSSIYSAYYDYINGCFFSNPGCIFIKKKIIAWSELGEGDTILEQVLNSELVQFKISEFAIVAKHICADIDPDGLVSLLITPYPAIDKIIIKVEQDESN